MKLELISPILSSFTHNSLLGMLQPNCNCAKRWFLSWKYNQEIYKIVKLVSLEIV